MADRDTLTQTVKQPLQLCDLAEELLVEICSHLPKANILNLRLASKLFSKVTFQRVCEVAFDTVGFTINRYGLETLQNASENDTYQQSLTHIWLRPAYVHGITPSNPDTSASEDTRHEQESCRIVERAIQRFKQVKVIGVRQPIDRDHDHDYRFDRPDYGCSRRFTTNLFYAIIRALSECQLQPTRIYTEDLKLESIDCQGVPSSSLSDVEKSMFTTALRGVRELDIRLLFGTNVYGLGSRLRDVLAIPLLDTLSLTFEDQTGHSSHSLQPSRVMLALSGPVFPWTLTSFTLRHVWTSIGDVERLLRASASSLQMIALDGIVLHTNADWSMDPSLTWAQMAWWMRYKCPRLQHLQLRRLATAARCHPLQREDGRLRALPASYSDGHAIESPRVYPGCWQSGALQLDIVGQAAVHAALDELMGPDVASLAPVGGQSV